MNNSQVAHLWGNPDTRKRNEARGSNFWFNGDTIYSYGGHNFEGLLARIHKYKKVNYVLVASQWRHSSTTSRHHNEAMQAVRHLTKFVVADATKKPNADDVRRYRKVIAGMVETARAAKSKKKWCLENLVTVINEANLFAVTFGFKSRFALPEGFEESQAKAIADYEAKESVRNAARAERARVRAIAYEAECADKIKQWLAGEIDDLPWGIGTIYLRVKNGEAQTSHGARVPLAEAEKAIRFIFARREKGYEKGLDSVRVGDFELRSITPEIVIIGCHRLTWPILEGFRLAQGWL